MRVTVVIDDNLMKAALEASGFKTRRQAIDEGLRLLIDLHWQKEIRTYRGKLKWTK